MSESISRGHENDLISRQAAIDALNDVVTITGFTNATVFQDYVRRVNNRLHELSSVQSEIIRCKDCKHYDPNDHCYLQGAEADDFCSYAERREA